MANFKSNLIWTVIVALIAVATSGYCDVMVKQVVQTDEYSMMGQTMPETIDTTVIWLGEGMARFDQSDTSSWIYQSEDNVVYMLNHKDKTYSEFSFDDVPSGPETNDDDADNMKEMMGEMGSMMKLKITVTPTDETKKINDWNCKKYLVESKIAMMTAKSETWATEDVEIDYELLTTVSNSFMSILPDFKDAVEEMKKIKGFTVLNEVTTDMMGASMKSITKVLEYKEDDPPDGIYKVTAGYKKTDLFRY